MATPNFKIVGAGAASIPTWTWQTEANAVNILAGDLCKLKAAGSPYALGLVDADLTLGTDLNFLGLAKTTSTETASADGTVEIYMPLPGLVYEGKATTAANVDTAAKISALCGDRVTVDVSGTTVTVDENDGDGVAKALLITGGDPVRGTLQFVVTWWSNAVHGA